MKKILLFILFLGLAYASQAQKNPKKYLLDEQHEHPELIKHKHSEFNKQQLVQERIKEQHFLRARNEKWLKNTKQQKKSSKVAINADDRAILDTLYNVTDGDNWLNNSNWLTGDGSDWYGITLDENGRVTEINLHRNQLSGSIPAELGNLANLQILDLSSNQLNGSIPAELGNLTNLQRLVLSDNQLSGSFPAELSNLKNLQQLDLSYNQLSGNIPVEIGNLKNLQQLNLSYNQLSGNIPVEIGNLTNLQRLVLYGNRLSGSIPAELGNLTNLQWLYLNRNQLSSSIPVELGNLRYLRVLNLSSNQLSGSIPVELENLTDLSYLYLNGNQFSGSIPAELGNLVNLHELDLSSNQLSDSIPVGLMNLLSLQVLNLSSNQLIDSIPVELRNLKYLNKLYLDGNQFTSLPDLSSLVHLYSWGTSVKNNSLDFGDLESSSISWYIYAPQAKVGTEQNIEISEGESQSISVSVDGSNNSYQWYKDNIAIDGATDSEYTISNFTEASDTGVYVCKIKDSNYPDLTLESNNITVTKGAASAIDVKRSSQFSIYPNPVSGRLSIHFLKEKAEILKILDLTGKQLFSRKVNSINESVNLSGLKSGVYILQLEFKNQTISKKIVKN